jgi:predicted Zn-dependent peptidase
MAFKGTSRRDTMQIAKEIEAAGGEINASTAMETTAYYARVLKDDWKLALDILADILMDPVFDESELAREQDVILQEIAAANDTPDDLVFDLAQLAAYPEHPLGRSILGTAERVSAYAVSDIAGYRDSHYTGERIVVSAAGNIDHNAMVEETRTRLATLKAGNGNSWKAPEFTGGPQLVERPLDQTHIVLSFPGVAYNDDSIMAQQVLAGVLGGGMSSRLFQEVREKRGLCYSVFAFASSYADGGNISVYAATAPDKAAELVEVTSDVILSLLDNIDDDEVDRTKAQIKASLVMSLESASSRCDQIARQFFAFGEVPDISHFVAKIDEVSTDDLKTLAARLFKHPRPALAAVGDLSGLATYEQMAARFA